MITSEICKVGLKIIFQIKTVKIYTVQNVYQVFCNAGCRDVFLWGFVEYSSRFECCLKY